MKPAKGFFRSPSRRPPWRWASASTHPSSACVSLAQRSHRLVASGAGRLDLVRGDEITLMFLREGCHQGFSSFARGPSAAKALRTTVPSMR